MGNIVLLDDLTINKIAAGEVIERPASVVKEMVENSIDAGAKNIVVEIQKGGISLIRIKDDGCGIAEDDMEIAFERHATSKIRSADDLENVRSMGFRGEALASIAAIAKVEMISKRVDSEVGNKIVVEGGKIIEKTETGCPVGTTITVQNLFFNTPVRYKFLKKNYTEAGYIEDAITRIALVNKNVSIKLISDGKTIVQTNGNGNLKDVIYSIYGKDIASEIIEVNYEYEDMKVVGVIGNPVIARSNRSNQIFFVNGRYVKDKSLSSAAEQAYKGIIPVSRYGFLILNLEIDPKKVDVNVHPAKLEVRFENESLVFKAIYHAIKAGLTGKDFSEDEKGKNNIFNNFSFDKLDEKNNYTTNNESEDSNEKKGISGIFQKIIKEPELTEAEKNSNTLEEVYEFRKGLKELGINPVSTSSVFNIGLNNHEDKVDSNLSSININKYSEFAHKLESKAVVNNGEDYLKNVENNDDNNITKLSDTKELDVNIVNNIIKEKTQELLSIKSDNKQETQIIPNVKIENKLDDTQRVNISKANAELLEKKEEANSNYVSEIKNKTEEENDITENSENTNLNYVSEIKSEIEAINDITEKNEETNSNYISEIKDNTQSINTFSNLKKNQIDKENLYEKDGFSIIAEKLVEAKMVSDNTQMIDTLKVREALKSANNNNYVYDSKDGSKVEFDEMYKKTFGVDPNYVRKEKEQENLEKEKIDATTEMTYVDENISVFEDADDIAEIKYRFLGITFDSYIIIEIKNEMYIVDIFAAKERIIYEKIKYNYEHEEERDEQFLLLPDVISLTKKQMIVAKENIYMFSKAGFSFEEFGENTIKLISVPGICESLNTKQLFIDILNEIDKVAVIEIKEKEEKFISTIANRVMQKTKTKLEKEEAESLLNDLFALPDPFVCPGGKNIAMKMTKYDLERKFNRK